jgi:hypothetical protein
MAGYYQRNTTTPCHDCYITWLQMGLEHSDGRRADGATGMWLHHGVMHNRNQTNSVCGTPGQPMAASGNERTPIDISAGGTLQTGYYIGKEDQIALVVDLMNMRDVEQDDIVFTITYEYVKSAEFTPITLYWLDVGGCGESEVPAYKSSTFNYSSPHLKGSQDGTITFVGGHLHDGGSHIDLLRNDQVFCTSEAEYDTKHIASMGVCTMLGEISPLDEWYIQAYYNTNAHEPMSLLDGSLEPVMGIMLVYVAHGLIEHWYQRPNYWKIVLGLGCLTAVVLGVAAYLWWRSTGRVRLTTRAERRPVWNRDVEDEEDSDLDDLNMPLVGGR